MSRTEQRDVSTDKQRRMNHASTKLPHVLRKIVACAGRPTRTRELVVDYRHLPEACREGAYLSVEQVVNDYMLVRVAGMNQRNFFLYHWPSSNLIYVRRGF